MIKPARKLIPLAAVAAVLASAPAASAAEQTFVGEVPTGTIGPYEVKQDITFPVPTPPTAGYITKMETDIVDATTGDPVPISRLMLHHIVFASIGKPDSTCHGQGFNGFDSRPDPLLANVPIQRFYAAGEERAKLSLPAGYGYENPEGAFWGITYMVMNHRSVPDNALIQYKVTYEDDPAGEGLTPVTPWWLDVRDCRADPIYNVPGVKKKAKKGKKGKGKKSAAAPTHVESKDYTFPAGRIVAGAGHVHGGAFKLTVTQPDCNNRQVADSNPTWGLPDHPFYTVRPVLHEPGPINMSAFHSQAGIPVGQGSTIRLNSLYDNSRPHTRVMGIYLVFVAPPNPGPPPQSCDPLPGDVQTFSTDQPGRSGPIPYTIPLTGLNAQGQAVTIKKPPGKTRKAKSGDLVEVKDRFFDKPNLEVTKGTKLNYLFSGTELHNLTLANGPLGIGTDNLNANRAFRQKFTRTGTYNFFCGLHPVQMSQRVVVKKKKKKGK